MSFDFLNHCKNCPSSTTHCCTKKGNIVLINEDEKVQIQNHFDTLKNELKIENLDTYTLFNEAKTQNGVTPLNLISTKDPDSQEDIDRCPFFVKPFCKLHTLGKPLDCKLWPVSKFENGDKGLVYIDYNCSALISKDKIPVSTIDESIALFNTLTDEKKSVYYNQSSSHYQLAPIPKSQWNSFQKYFAYKEEVTNKCGKKFNQFKNTYIDIFSNTKLTIRVSKWIIGIFFVMILTSMFNLVANNVSNYNHSENSFLSQTGYIERFVILIFLPIIFILDAFRIIVPLPWITKYIDEKSNHIPELRNEKDNLPKFQLLKLLVIGILSFILLNTLAIKFIYFPLWYFTLYSAVLLLDMFWYSYNRKIHDFLIRKKNIDFEINEVKKFIENQIELVTRELNSLIPKEAKHLSTDSIKVLENQIKDLKNRKENYINNLSDQAISAKLKEKTIQELEEKVEEEYSYSLIIILNLILCLIYPTLYIIQNESLFEFKPFDIIPEKLTIYLLYIIHTIFIYVELKKYNFYLDELNYFYLKEEKADPSNLN